MRRSPSWLGLCIGVGLGAGAHAQDAGIARFFGTWEGGAVTLADRVVDLGPDELDTTITGVEDGFRMRWTALERRADGQLGPRTVEARFEETDRPNVYAFRQEAGSLFTQFFASPSTGNPLEGETLLWARRDGATLYVYSLGLTPAGGFDLDRFAYSSSDGALDLVYTRRDEDGSELVVEARLAKGE